MIVFIINVVVVVDDDDDLGVDKCPQQDEHRRRVPQRGTALPRQGPRPSPRRCRLRMERHNGGGRRTF